MIAVGKRLPGLRRAVWVISAALVLVGATAGEAAADGEIAGRVTQDQGGAAAANACVSASSSSNPEVIDLTDVNGDYLIVGLAAGTDYSVRFYPCGSGNLISEYYDDKPDIDSADSVAVVDGVTTSDIDAGLATGGSITGTVTGPGGPVDAVCVAAEGQSDAGSARTDATGDYAIEGLPTGDYKVSFTPCDPSSLVSEFYDNQQTSAAADPVPVVAGVETQGIDAVLALGGTISGTVTGPGGALLVDICVTAADAGFDNAGTTETDANGEYTIQGLREADYKVKFFSCAFGSNFATEFYNDKPTRASADALVVTEGSTTSGIDADLVGGATISGTVTGPGGALVADVCVTTSDDEDGAAAVTDVNGDYALEGLRAGSYKVRFAPCSASGLLSEFYDDKPTRALADPVAVAAGVTTPNINAQLATEGKITGTVTSPGAVPLEGICVDGDDAGFQSGDSTVTDASGQYTLQGLRAGAYKLEFRSCGNGNFAREFYDDKPTRALADPVAVAAGVTTPNINAQLAVGGRITGTVTGPGGAPQQGVCVHAADANLVGESAGTDAFGEYTIEDLRAGTYKVEFSACGSGNFVGEFYDDKPTRAAADALSVTTGSTRSNVDAELAGGGIITGRVTGPGGVTQPLGGICVAAADAGLNEVSTETDVSGDYTLQGLPPDIYKVEFSACGSGNFATEFYNDKPTRAAAGSINVTVGSPIEGVDAELSTGGKITGTVTGPGGVLLQGICVSASNSDLEPGEPVVTDVNGEYAIEGLGSDSYRVLFVSCGAGNLAHEWYTDKATVTDANLVPVTAGATTGGVNIELGAGGTISGVVSDGTDPVAGACVRALDPQNENFTYSVGETGVDGSYVLDGLGTGSFKVHFDGRCSSSQVGDEWYADAGGYGAAGLVAVSAPGTTPSIDAVLPILVAPPSVTVDSGPTGSITDRRPIFAFTASGADTVECSISDAAPAYGPCSDVAGHQPASDLTDGDYSFVVKVTNSTGSATDVRSFTVTTPVDPPPVDPPPVDPPPVDPPPVDPGQSAACDQAKQKLIKAKYQLSKAKDAGHKAKVKKAKKKVKKAKKAVAAAC